MLTANQQSTLGECRGKLLLIRRFELDTSLGFNVSRGWRVNHPSFEIELGGGTCAKIEDLYLFDTNYGDAAHHLGEKWDATVHHLESARQAIPHDDKALWITFTSAVGDKRKSEIENVTPRVSDKVFAFV